MAKQRFGNPDIIPDPLLIALISQFLSNHGFNASLRIFNTERRKRPKKHQIITDTYGAKYTQGIPQLDEIFRSFMTKQNAEKQAKTDAGSKISSATPPSVDGESEDDSDSSGSDSDSADSISGQLEAEETESATRTKSSSPSSSDSDDTSASSAEEDTTKTKPDASKNTLKRKASSLSSDSSSSSSESGSGSESSSEEKPPTKRAKIETSPQSKSDSDSESSASSISNESETQSATVTKKGVEIGKVLQAIKSQSATSSESDSSSSASSSEEDASEEEEKTPKADTAAATLVEASSDTSATITGDVHPSRAFVPMDKKHTGARPTKLAELSTNARDGEYISNNYVSYDYADRAYNDLSVTRGKGFTKEKNKKKRGSYRGGAIDTSGGKAFKFED